MRGRGRKRKKQIISINASDDAMGIEVFGESGRVNGHKSRTCWINLMRKTNIHLI